MGQITIDVCDYCGREKRSDQHSSYNYYKCLFIIPPNTDMKPFLCDSCQHVLRIAINKAVKQIQSEYKKKVGKK